MIAKNSINFKGSYVILSKKNNGDFTKKNVVDAFNDNYTHTDSKVSDSVNFFIPAAGEGSRFKIAKMIGNYNKVNLPINTDCGIYIHPLDFIMMMGRIFTDKSGVQTIMEDEPKGSFSGIVKHYMEGNPIKDTVICSADSMFKNCTENIILDMIANPDIKIGIIGGIRRPEELKHRYGILDVNQDNMGLKGFIEKPDINTAKKFTLDGKNIVNTGYYYFSKEIIEKLMEEIANGKNNIKKNDNELYDFALAIEYVQKNLQKWFNHSPEKISKVAITDGWADTGEPEGFYDFSKMVKKGDFLQGFPKEIASSIKKAFERIFHFEETIPYANFTDSDSIPTERIAQAPEINGIKIIA